MGAHPMTPSGRTCDADIIERCGPTDWERYRCGAEIVSVLKDTRMTDDNGDPVTITNTNYVCTQGHPQDAGHRAEGE